MFSYHFTEFYAAQQLEFTLKGSAHDQTKKFMKRVQVVRQGIDLLHQHLKLFLEKKFFNTYQQPAREFVHITN